MKKVVALTLALVMCLFIFAGCGSDETPSSDNTAGSGGASSPGSSSPSPSPTSGSSQQIGQEGGSIVADPGMEVTSETRYYEELTMIQDNTKTPVLDPHNTAAGSSSNDCVFTVLYDRLVQRKEGGLEPGLALSWEGDDLQHFTFHLRPGVLFHNGETLTAEDVAYTIDRVNEVGVGTRAYTNWSAVETYEIIDDHTIKLNLKSVNVDFIRMLSEAFMGIINKKACEADPEYGTWIGTGPFMVETFVSNEYGVYVANENYWLDPPITKKLTIKFVAEETSRLIALQNNEADVVAGINPVHFDDLYADPNFMTFAYTVNNPIYVTFNLNDPLMADVNFRKAVMYALYRPDIILAARDGYGEEPTAGMFWGFGTEFKNENVPIIQYDPELAKQFLADSSYNGESVEICTAIPDISAGAQVVQQQLAQIGINTSIYQTDPPGMAAYATWGSNQFQIQVFVGGWTNTASSSRQWFYPQSNNNRPSLDDPEITALLDLAPTLTDVREREAAYHQIQELVAEHYIFYLIYWTKHIIASQTGVGGIVFHNDTVHDYTYIYRIIED